MQTKSPHFEGTIGKTISPEKFPAANYLIDDSRYDYEGNWAFCRFENEDVLGARFGFGRGVFDWSDYGSTAPLDRSNLWIHLELMTREGAVLWIGTGRFKAGQVQIAHDKMDIRLGDDGHEIFHIAGWPQMRWHFQADDGEAEVKLQLTVRYVTILPDCVMPHNRFAMWLSICEVEGEVRFQDQRTRVRGTAFYDHPRIVMTRNCVPLFGWYLYTPMVFSDGSYLAGYYSQDGNGQQVEEYSFGLFVDATGKALWLPSVQFNSIRLDSDDKPDHWRSTWSGVDFDAEILCTVRPTAIRKAWGGPAVAQTRRENNNMPLVFDAEGTIRSNGAMKLVRGGGLAEYLVRAGFQRTPNRRRGPVT